MVESLRLLLDLKRRMFDLQDRARAHQVVATHYDLPACLFEAMLGATMAYSCAYWKDAGTLDEAQRAKLDLVCRKLRIGPSDCVLDLGCGFGSFARYAAETRGCSVVGVSLSASQAAYARRYCDGLPVEIHRCDYREVDSHTGGRRFDKVVSIAMLEAVGRKSYRKYMEIVSRLLKSDGLWLLHTIGDQRSSCDPWLNKYVFPNGEIPTMALISDSIGGLFHIEDVHAFGMDYWRTLTSWAANFERCWGTLRSSGERRFDERFQRLWTYYLCCCAGAFRSRNLDLWQIVLSQGPSDYRAVR